MNRRNAPADWPSPPQLAELIDLAASLAEAEGSRLARHDPLTLRRILARAALHAPRQRHDAHG